MRSAAPQAGPSGASIRCWLSLGVLLLSSGCGDGGTGPTNTTTTTAPRIVTTEFTISRPSCFFGWSRPLESLSIGESFTVRFKPLSVDYMESADWANTVDFWLDRLSADDDDAIGLIFNYVPDSRWWIDYFTPEGGFETTGKRELIHVNGDFREITFVRSEGVSKWLLDGEVILELVDHKPERMVYTRVVGTDALFQYEMTTSALATVRPESELRDCRIAEPIACGGRPGS